MIFIVLKDSHQADRTEIDVDLVKSLQVTVMSQALGFHHGSSVPTMIGTTSKHQTCVSGKKGGHAEDAAPAPAPAPKPSSEQHHSAPSASHEDHHSQPQPKPHEEHHSQPSSHDEHRRSPSPHRGGQGSSHGGGHCD